MTVAMLSFLVVFHEIRHELLISFSMVLRKFDVIAFGIIAFLFFFVLFWYADAFPFMYLCKEGISFNYTIPFVLIILSFIMINLFVVAIIFSSFGGGFN